MTGGSPTDPAPTPGDPAGRTLEVVGVLVVLGCLGAFLLESYSLIVYSDPMRWYLFGRDFADRFADTRLAFGFPLLMAGAIAVVGPVRAYLVNLPVVIAMAALLYLFARHQVRTREPAAAALGAMAAVVLLVLVDTRLVLGLVNPYRDALSYVFALLAGVLVIRAVRSPERASRLATAAGVALAAATSTRETSILLLLPFGLYALTAKLANRRLALLRPALGFALGFAIACVPLLIQNQLSSGSAFVPGQAAEVYAKEGSLVPGIRLAHLPQTLPQVVDELRERYGRGLPLLMGMGLVLAVWRRQAAVLALSLPALCLYVLFYGAYARRVTRYLFVADLFAFCIAAAGVAILADLVLTAFRNPKHPARIALAVGFAAAAAALLEPRPPPRDRLTLDGVERFVQDFDAALPANATVVGMRPVTDLVRGFTNHDLELVRNLWDLHLRLPELFGGSGERALVARGGSADAIVARGYDLVDASRLDPASYGLQRRFGEELIHVSRVVPWTHKQSITEVEVEEPGQYMLQVEVGRLSQESREGAHVVWNGKPLSAQPVDGVNHYAVRASRGGPAQLRLLSDRPVPGRITARAAPLRWPVVLDFSEDRLLQYASRLSWSFLLWPRLGYAAIVRDGTVDVPTVRPKNAAYVVQARVALVPGPEAYERVVILEAGNQRVGEWTLRADADDGSGPAWQDLSFVLHEPFVGDPRTRLRWYVEDVSREDPRPALGMSEIRVQRVVLRDTLRIELATQRSRVYRTGGFRGLEPRFGRWTGGRAVLRLFTIPTKQAGSVSLRYGGMDDVSGAGQRPRFRFDGRAVEAHYSKDKDGTSVRIPIAAGGLDAVEHELEILLPEGSGRGVLLRWVEIEAPGGA